MEEDEEDEEEDEGEEVMLSKKFVHDWDCNYTNEEEAEHEAMEEDEEEDGEAEDVGNQ